jgi:hypothetical protein
MILQIFLITVPAIPKAMLDAIHFLFTGDTAFAGSVFFDDKITAIYFLSQFLFPIIFLFFWRKWGFLIGSIIEIPLAVVAVWKIVLYQCHQHSCDGIPILPITSGVVLLIVIFIGILIVIGSSLFMHFRKKKM